MNGHTIHSLQQVWAKGVCLAAKLNLLVNLLLQEQSLLWCFWSALGVIPSEWPFPIVGIGKGPESLTQSSTQREHKGLIGMRGEE